MIIEAIRSHNGIYAELFRKETNSLNVVERAALTRFISKPLHGKVKKASIPMSSA